jgi:hypothetical protein
VTNGTAIYRGIFKFAKNEGGIFIMRCCEVFSSKRACALVGFLLFLSSFGVAQSNNGRILGTVTDQTGAVLSGAKVTITDTERGISRTLTTNEVGEYVAPNLQPGLYKITGEASNFKKVERPAIRLEVAKDLRIDLQLTAGNASEIVTVTDEAPLVETTSDTLGGTFTNKAINDLPLNGRDFQNLVTLRPGVQRYPGGGFLSISSNGVRPEDNNFIVDGTDNNDPYYGGTVINAEGVQGTPATHLPIDAIQEFNALENPPAEYGWKPGAIVNVGLKSGTNAIHGTAYYFRRDRNFDARNWFNQKPAPQKPLRLNQYGATVGGPIKKDKLFYFLAFEGVGDLVGNSESLASPNIGTLGGDTFNSVADAEADLALNNVPLSPLSTSLIPLLPNLPGTIVNGTNNIKIGFPNRNREDDGLAKVDYHFSERHVLTGRYFVGDSTQTERDIPVLQSFWQSQAVTRASAAGANWTWTINNNLVNEAKFGYNRFWQTILTADATQDPNNYKLGGGPYHINTGITTPINFGFPEIDISGFNQLGGNHGWPLETTPDQTLQFTDNMSWTHGKHTIRFGGEVRHGSTFNVRDRYGKSRIQFKGGNTLGIAAGSSPLEDFLAGNPAAGRVFVGDSRRHVTINSFGGFVQDDFRLTPRLTVNLGVRYDLTTPIKEKNNLLANFDPNNPKGLLQVGTDIKQPYNTDANNFAPRVGISWDPSGKGKTVIRAGGGITYEIPHIAIFIGQNGVDNATTAGLNVIPTGANGVTPGGGKIVAASLDVTPSWNTAGPLFQLTNIDCSVTPCAILAVNRNLRTPYIATWNFNVQQELTRNTSLQIGYVGSKGTKLYSVYDINQVNQSLDNGTEQFGRPFTYNCPVAQGGAGVGGPCFNYLSFVNYLSNGYESKYAGLQASLTQRAWRGLSFVAGYTWAHALDQASLNRAIQPQDSLHPEKEYASSDIDIRHRFTLALSYELPGRKSFAQMLEGWQVNSIITVQSGLPWSVIDGFATTGGTDISRTAEFADRWDFFGSPSDFKPSVAGIPFFFAGTPPPSDPLGPTDPAFAINNAACVSAAAANGLDSSMPLGCYTQGKAVMLPPVAGTFGTMRRNLFRGPNFRNVDFSVVKKWKFNERAGMQFRVEMFNILNHPNFTNPYGVGGQLGNVDPSVGGFGASSATTDVAAANPVIGSGGPRAIQLGIKFSF